MAPESRTHLELAKPPVPWPPEGSAVGDALSSTDWSKTLLGPPAKWPWYWRVAVTAAFDPGPGRRSGDGTVTILPFLVKSLAVKTLPDEADRAQR